MKIGMFLILFGGFITVISLSADLLGIGDDSGIHGAQLLSALGGIVLLYFGLKMHLPRLNLQNSRIFHFIRKILEWKSIGIFFACTGFFYIILFSAVTLFTPGKDPGLNRETLLGLFSGFAWISLGLWMWRPDKVASRHWLFRGLAFLMSRRTIGFVLIAAGTSFLLILLKGSFFVMSESGLGFFQNIAIIIGAVVILTGAWLLFIYGKVSFNRLNPHLNHNILQRIYGSLFLLTIGVTAIFLINNIFSRVNLQTKSFNCINYFKSYGDGIGADYRTGIYRPVTEALLNEEIYLTRLSNYPPFTILFFTPLQLFTENTGYLIMVFVLTMANILSLLLVTNLVKDWLLRDLQLEPGNAVMIALAIFMAVLFYSVSGYPFMFSIERGNYDSLAIFFAILAIFLVIKKPESLWWQVILLSIATHLKIYPGALFIVLLYKHGKKVILPLIIVNTMMLFSLGMKNLDSFMEIMVEYTLAPSVWSGNHSGFSFAAYLAKKVPLLQVFLGEMKVFFSALPVVIWVISSLYCIRKLSPEKCMLMLLMIATPLMCMLPTVSHDYKLVVLHPALLILTGMLVYNIIHYCRLWDYVQLILVLVISLFIGRSYVLMPSHLWWLTNKYPLLLLLSLLMLLNAITLSETHELLGLTSVTEMQLHDKHFPRE